MRKHFLLFILVAICHSSLAQYGYKCGSKFINLKPMDSPIRLVKLEDNSILDGIKDQQGKSRCISKIAKNYFLIDSTSKKLIKPIYESDVYKSKHGYNTIVLPEIVVSVVNADDIFVLEKQFAGILSLKEKKKGRYVLKCNRKSSEEVLKLVQEIDRMNCVRWCKPGMLSEVRFESNSDNTYFSDQYYLQNSPTYGGVENAGINAVKAWEIVSGNPNIKVAVIDQGVERDHEDLQGAVLDGYTCGFPAEKGDPIHENYYDLKGHGIACAGIIAAVDNDRGIKGVASGVKILPINISPDYAYKIGNNIYGTFADAEDIADAIDWAVDNEADVISCSWTHEEDTCITNSLNNAMAYGRNGKGCIIVASSGNEYHNGDYWAGYPSNLLGVICVGAINRNCEIWYYSQRGVPLDFVAPSGDGNSNSDIYTTDRMYSKGYNYNGHYIASFGGTSAACPQVAGTAALILSANPNLTRSQVYYALMNTAKDLGTTGFDTTFGYGIVNAYAAVYSVAAHNIVGPDYISSSCSYSIDNLQSGATVEWSLSDSYYNQNCLQQNYPSQNQCTISYSSTQNMMNATLTAVIKYNGTIIQTLTKNGISAYHGFSGTYSSSTGSGSYTAPNPIFTAANTTVQVNSQRLVGATITFSGDATPSYFTHNNNIINVKMPSSGNTIVVYIHCTNGDNFTIPIIKTYSMYQMSVNFNGEMMNITLDESVSEDLAWTLEIYNVVTGDKIVTQNVSGRSVSINTSGWKKGLYAARATIDKEVLTEKIQVR